MYLIRKNQPVPEKFRHAVVSIGNFDGVHMGHQQLLSALKAKAKALSCACGVIIFEPQPQEFFLSNPPARLSSLREKFTLIKQQDIDFILVLRFNGHLAQLGPHDFIKRILADQLHIQEIWVGQDFCFGHQRLGDVDLLENCAHEYGFRVNKIPDVAMLEQRVSSTQIRNALAQGELTTVRTLLGRFFTIEGRVVAGDARGRTLNMRTANVRPRYKVPLQGIFVVRVRISNQEWPAVASVGVRPVFLGQTIILEVHIFNFGADIYGQRIRVEFLHKLREEKNFDSIELLQAQMQQDALDAKHYWKHHHDEL